MSMRVSRVRVPKKRALGLLRRIDVTRITSCIPERFGKLRPPGRLEFGAGERVVSHSLVEFEPILLQTFSLSQKQDREYPWNTLMSAAPRPAGSLLDATDTHLSYGKISHSG